MTDVTRLPASATATATVAAGTVQGTQRTGRNWHHTAVAGSSMTTVGVVGAVTHHHWTGGKQETADLQPTNLGAHVKRVWEKLMSTGINALDLT
eukprot:COSAG06_NODE_19803_length_822_cov_0.954357_1_plen_94_part_00